MVIIEKFQVIQNWCMIGTFVFTVLAALSGLGWNYYGKKINEIKGKEQKYNSENKSNQILNSIDSSSKNVIEAVNKISDKETLRKKEGQDIRNSKRTELYEKVEYLRGFFIKSKNDPSFNVLDPIFSQTKDLLIFLGSNDAFKDLEPEMIIIQNDYNSWVTLAKQNNGKNITINFDKTSKAFESIQKKLMK